MAPTAVVGVHGECQWERNSSLDASPGDTTVMMCTVRLAPECMSWRIAQRARMDGNEDEARRGLVFHAYIRAYQGPCVDTVRPTNGNQVVAEYDDSVWSLMNAHYSLRRSAHRAEVFNYLMIKGG